MNKRLKKKKQKEKDLFVSSFVSSYKEYKQFERRYYEYYIQRKKQIKLRHLDAKIYWLR